MGNSRRLGYMVINGISDISDQQSQGADTHPSHNTKYNSDTGCEFWSVLAYGFY